MIDSHPVGYIVDIVGPREAVASGRWRLCDGSRLRRRDDPVLYDLLRPRYRRKWRRWIVHLPDLRVRAPQIVPNPHGGPNPNPPYVLPVSIIRTGLGSPET